MNEILFIGGGSVWPDKQTHLKAIASWEIDPREEKKRWRYTLKNTGFETFIVEMPNKDWADYDAWKIVFEKYLEHTNNPILVGHSLGAIFLIKYLSENTVTAHQLHLVAPALYEDDLSEEILGNFQAELENIPKINYSTTNIHIYHSVDDPVCPYQHSVDLHELLIEATLHRLENRGHLNEEEFPELLKHIN